MLLRACVDISHVELSKQSNDNLSALGLNCLTARDRGSHGELMGLMIGEATRQAQRIVYDILFQYWRCHRGPDSSISLTYGAMCWHIQAIA